MNNKQFTPHELHQIAEQLGRSILEIRTESESSVKEMQNLMNDSYSDPGDRASLESNRNREIRIQERNGKLVGKIEEALKRIEQGTYQACSVCGEEISKERLLARPVTSLCIHCKELQEREEWT